MHRSLRIFAVMSKPNEVAARGPFQLIAAANTNDRFRLLEDSTVQQPDLNIPIHPIFQCSNFPNAGRTAYKNLHQGLQLASMFLYHDSTLEWFISPLLGHSLIDTVTWKSYLSNPSNNKTDFEKKILKDRVRNALRCLSHCIHFRFIDTGEQKFYARTQIHSARPAHKPSCAKIFGSTQSVRIDIRKQYWNYLQNNYTSSSLCERLRQDFSFAVNIVHELCHAIGVMRRGDLIEPHIRLDHPEKPEFGYAWENFMFGGILNPFDRSSDGISFLMRKVWAEDKDAMDAGGKEWTAVPVSYVAQWFQTSTWDLVAKLGPTAIPPPPIELRLRATRSYYTVLTGNPEALADVSKLQKETRQYYAPMLGKISIPNAALVVLTAKRQLTSAPALQHSLIPTPSRTPSWTSARDAAIAVANIEELSQIIESSVKAIQQGPLSPCCGSEATIKHRKRSAMTLEPDQGSTTRPPKRVRA